MLKVAALLQLELVLVVCFRISGHQQHLSSCLSFVWLVFPALVVSVYLSNICSFYLLGVGHDGQYDLQPTAMPAYSGLPHSPLTFALHVAWPPLSLH